MSQHPSLLGSQKGKQQKSVLKRYEKLKTMIEKEKWDEKNSSIYSLPKIKAVRFKVKKEKAAVAETPAEGAAAPAAGAPAAGAPVKAAAAKAPAETKAPAKDKKSKA